ncbi:MAG: S9 family peptidase [Theionarchaea archaeon]|nr:S9 family peptidase [Theionarchaea archaeon]
MSSKRFITAEDLYNFNLISSCRISPDSYYIVYCVHRVDKKTEKKYSNIWVVPTSGGEPQQFTYGDHADSQPKWSPSGAEIAFISNRDDEKQPQIYVMPFHGGEARKLTDLKGEIENFEWSPDSSKLLVSFRKKDAEEIEREKDSQKKELGIVSRHITRVFFKLDGKGYLPKERLHLWIVSLQGECLQLTDSDIYDEQTPAWSPDGEKIVFCSNHAEDPDLDLDAVDLFVIPSTGGDLYKIETPVGLKWNPQFSPDGKWVAYFGYEERGQYWKNISLWVVPEDGSGKAQNLTEKFDFHVSTDTINDLPGALPMMPPTWSQDSKKIYVQVSRHGSTKIMSVSLNGVSEPFVDKKGVIGSFTFDKEQSKLSYLYAHMKDPGEVFVHDMATNTGQKLTHVNEDLLQSLNLGEVEEVWFKGADNNDLQGWIIRPPDFEKSKKYPSILEIHGGPYVQYGNFFMHEFFFLAANGYVVYFCNPRGGQGYGEAHSKAIWNNWGTADYDDLMAWTDCVEKTGYIDSKRMGVTGGSYGGFMTNWIIGHTNRFKAAATQRSVSNMVSMYGTSDFNWPLQYEVGDEPPWENHENYWRQSPLKYIKNCQTPTLIIHSEQDMRADVEQGLQVFVALKRLGIDTELVLFPDEPHGLSREGRTDRRVARLNYIKNWFDRYLK